MSLIWFSGFETGDTSEWKFSGGTLSVQTTTVNPGGGNYALQAGLLSGTLGSNFVQPANTFASGTTLFSRGYFRVHGLTASIAIRQFVIHALQLGVGTEILEVCVTTDASSNPSLQLNNQVAGAVIGSAFPIKLDTWYCVEVRLFASATVGTAEMRVNGQLVASSVGNLNTGTGTTYSPYVGAVNQVGTGTPLGQTFVDDFALSTTGYIGGGVCLARQFTATTPNYNTFTKSNASTINTVWDDTPFATATNATDAVSTGKQTGVVDFSTTGGAVSSGSQHSGPQVVRSNDVINAAKIGAVAKTGTASDAADSIIFRTPAGGAGVDTITAFAISFASLAAGWATTDGWNDVVLGTTPTAAQILNCEAGIQHNATTNTHTYEDVWIMVDIAPVVLPLPIFHRTRAKRRVTIVKRPVHSRIEFIVRPNFIESAVLRHRQQPHRVFVAKAKNPLRTRWIVDRQVTAPHADFPPILRHRQQRHRIVQVGAKRVVRGKLKPPALPAVPPELRARRRPKRIAQVQTKRPVRERLPLPPQPKKVLPLPVFARQRIKRRMHLIGKKSWILVFYGTAVAPPPPFVDIARWRGTARRGSAIHGSD